MNHQREQSQIQPKIQVGYIAQWKGNFLTCVKHLVWSSALRSSGMVQGWKEGMVEDIKVVPIHST